MSVCIEQNQKNNFSLDLPTCNKSKSLRSYNSNQIIRNWIERSRQRKHLARLDDRMLKDIGLNRAQVQIEISKPFWK